MKRITLFVVSFLFLAFLAINVPMAQAFSPTGVVCSTGGAGSSTCTDPGPQNIYGANGVINKAGEIFSIVIGLISVIMIIIAGLEFMTSGGESQRISTAKNTIIYAVVGLIVVGLAQLILVFVINKIGGH